MCDAHRVVPHMKKIILIILLFPLFTKAQHTFIAVVKDQNTREVLPGATVQIKDLKLSASTTGDGIVVLKNIPDGQYDVEISHIGFHEVEQSIKFPLPTADTIEIYLRSEAATLDEVTVTSIRSGRSVKNTPTRVELIGEDEIHEEATMRPGDIRMLLSESTGIQTQQTSATSANASIRIQGLDGRYTQILKDGFPVYSGAATGLGLLQTPPLDLRQVEIIKGSSSTLYGGGAVAGLINLITKLPSAKRELNVNVNGTSAGGLDINSFYGQRFEKAGVTIFASRNTNKAYDPAKISFSAIPKFGRYTFNPKLFLYFTDKTKMNFGINTTIEKRLGGDMKYIEGNRDSLHSYFEENKTIRISTQFTLDHQLNTASSLKVKNSVGYFNRVINSKDYTFSGTQYSTFSEVTFVHNKDKVNWVIGLNLVTDQFIETPASSSILRNYEQTTAGAFIQNTWNTSDWLTIETGLRGDLINDYGFVLLPRISVLFKIAPGLTTRTGGGFGYKAPTIFTEESEKYLYKNILPVDRMANALERSYGTNWDVNYKVIFGKASFSINQFFFYTYLKDPLLLKAVSNGSYKFINIHGNVNTKGAETNVKVGYDEFNMFLGYTYTDARINDNHMISASSLTPKHRFNAALVYEIENKLRVGSELYYFSKQKLSDGSTGRGYWLTGLVVERFWKRFSLYINFENIGDVRQTKFENIYTGSYTNPVFKDIYAPLDGFVVNGGIKVKL